MPSPFLLLLPTLFTILLLTILHLLSVPPLYLSLLLLLLLGLPLLGLPLLHARPRAPFLSEKLYTSPASLEPSPLPCWFDTWKNDPRHLQAQNFHIGEFYVPEDEPIDPATLELSVVIPAYNEELRILPTLREAVAYLDAVYGRSSMPTATAPTGYEILIVDDGSKDATVQIALEFAAEVGLNDNLRVIRLARNRGKGGAVIHGLRHVRGQYVLFADADGATKFSDLEKLVSAIDKVVDGASRGIAIGSRARLVKDPQTLQRSALRNFLMRAFHFVLTILTPAATSRIKDTQCGFKLFTRAALPHIIPYMLTEGWIFDIEMLMLAESSPPAPITGADGNVIGTTMGIRVAEVPVSWHEVGGSKMSLVKDSVKMAWGLAVLRLSWMLGVYSRRELR